MRLAPRLQHDAVHAVRLHLAQPDTGTRRSPPVDHGDHCQAVPAGSSAGDGDTQVHQTVPRRRYWPYVSNDAPADDMLGRSRTRSLLATVVITIDEPATSQLIHGNAAEGCRRRSSHNAW